MTKEKKGAAPFENAPHGTTARADITTPAPEVEAPRGAYHPLTWRGADPQQPAADQAQQIPDTKTPDPVAGWHALADQARKAQKPFRGKHKRNSRRDAVASKRHQAGIADFELIVITVWLVVVLCAAAEAIGRALQ